MRIIEASVHQGNSRFYDMGKQCMANSVAAILKSKTVDPKDWSSKEMDNILVTGDKLYSCLKTQSCLMIEDFPEELDGFYYSFKSGKVYTGLTMTVETPESDNPFCTLEMAFTKTLLHPGSKCLFTMGNSTPSYTCAIVRTDSFYYLFDPHSRNNSGMPTPDGCAVTTEHSTVDALCLFIRHLSASVSVVKNIPFEVATIDIISDPTEADKAEDFDGFSDVSEGELSCLLFMRQEELTNSEISSVTSEELLSDAEIGNLNDSSFFINSINIDVFSQFIDDDLNVNENVTQTNLPSDLGLSKSPSVDLQLSKSTENPPVDLQFTKSAENPSIDPQLSELAENPTIDLPLSKSAENPTVDPQLCKSAENPPVDPQLSELAENPTVDPQLSKSAENPTVDPQLSKSAENPTVDPQLSKSAENPTVDPQLSKSAENPQVDPQLSKSAEKNPVDPQLSKSAENPPVDPQVSKSAEKPSVDPQVNKSTENNQVDPQVSKSGENLPVDPQVSQSAENPSVDPQVSQSAENPSVDPQVSKSAENPPVQVQVSQSAENLSLDPQVSQSDETPSADQQVCQSTVNPSVDPQVSQSTENHPDDPLVNHISGNPSCISTHCQSSDNSSENPALNINSHASVPYFGQQSEHTAQAEMTKLRSRKRKRNENNWKRNIIQGRKNTGKSYVTHSGKIKRARILKSGCGLSCKKKCHDKFDTDQREKIFHEFWATGLYSKQKEFISHSVKEVPVARVRNGGQKRRHVTRKYSFILNTESVEVCKQFFIDTLDISHSQIDTALEGRCPLSHITKKDRRGTHENRPNMVHISVKNDVKAHIESFPRVESHYCRKSSSKEYLEGDLSITEMYRLYVEQCGSNNVCPVKESMYRHIFNTEYNLAFHKPLKDQCDFCYQNSNMTPEQQKENAAKFDRHIKNKELARQEKLLAKQLAQSCPSKNAACFDLQQVMPLPKANQSCMFYSRKLNNYNLTVYSLGSSDAYCYVWNEALANRGACEIASCVFSYFKSMYKNDVKSITTFSDKCTAQNRNRIFVAMMWYSLKLLERGHTQNENDSVHSAIEKATTSQFVTSIQLARRSKPYHVSEMTSRDFFDFRYLSDQVRNFNIDTNGGKVKWMEIKTISFKSSSPDQAIIQYDYDGPLTYMNLQPNLRNQEMSLPTLKRLFRHGDTPKLRKVKYDDLQKLCLSNVILPSYHKFFEELPHEK